MHVGSEQQCFGGQLQPPGRTWVNQGVGVGGAAVEGTNPGPESETFSGYPN